MWQAVMNCENDALPCVQPEPIRRYRGRPLSWRLRASVKLDTCLAVRITVKAFTDSDATLSAVSPISYSAPLLLAEEKGACLLTLMVDDMPRRRAARRRQRRRRGGHKQQSSDGRPIDASLASSSCLSLSGALPPRSVVLVASSSPALL